MKRNQRYIKSLVYYFVFILCVLFYHKWEDINTFYTKAYLQENFSAKDELNVSLVDTDLKEDYEINSEFSICDNSETDVLFITYVNIAPHYFEKRNLIRLTYGQNSSKSSKFRLIFAMAMSNDKTINQKIKEESRLHKDILQIKTFKDSYFKLTKKVMKVFKWIINYCAHAKYALNICDDVILNKNNLINHFEKIPYRPNQIYGNLVKGSYPNRDLTSKFYVKWSEYALKKYPWYVDGKFVLEIN